MSAPISDIAFTPTVKAIQERRGSRRAYAEMEERGGWSTTVDAEMAAFIAERESFYLGTVNAEGQPYIQHRGGPPGFLRVIDERTLGFADFRGNRQYISIGNLEENEKAFIFLMDYANRRRVKIWGRAEYIEDDAALVDQLRDAEYAGVPERAIRFHIDALDINCPQHIPRLLSETDVSATVADLQARVADLETQLAAAQGTSPPA